MTEHRPGGEFTTVARALIDGEHVGPASVQPVNDHGRDADKPVRRWRVQPIVPELELRSSPRILLSVSTRTHVVRHPSAGSRVGHERQGRDLASNRAQREAGMRAEGRLLIAPELRHEPILEHAGAALGWCRVRAC